MDNDINTDKIFREKLEDFSSSPSPHIWDNVQTMLASQKRKRRIINMRWISAAAVIILAFLAGWYFNESQSNKMVTTEQKENKIQEEITLNQESNIEQDDIQVTDGMAINSKEEQPLKKAGRKVNNEFMVASADIAEGQEEFENARNRRKAEPELNMIIRSETKFSNEIISTELAHKSTVISSAELSEFEKNIIAENSRIAEISEQNQGSWKMGMSVAPGYSSHVANHTENYNQSMNYSDNNGNASLSGGISVQYKKGKRWSIESGAYYAKNGQKSEPSFNLFAMKEDAGFMADAPEDAYFSNTINVSQDNITMNSTAGVIAFSETPKGAEVSSEFDASRNEFTNSLISSGEFSQVFEFVEIPLFVRYQVVDKKFGVELMGGLNAGIVVGNNAYIDNQYGLQNVGETQDISPVNVSGTLGLGMNYAIGKHFSLAIEPRFNYYLNSINSNPEVDFRPFRIGFYSGIYYEF